MTSFFVSRDRMQSTTEAQTTIILVRHGQTKWNTELRFQGHSDSPLSELGEHQARVLGERLAGLGVAVLYSSDLGRALRTAQLIAEATGHEVIVEPRLRERNFGIFEGLTIEEIETRHPQALALWRTRDPHYAIPGGENTSEIYERTVACLNELADRHAGQTVAAVSHGLALDAFYRHVAGIPLTEPRTLKLLNASLNMFYRNGRHWRLGALSDVAHLAPSAVTPA
jgi:2,3-bisphosphoglycerate-dependent phosphoglycerate mutase